MPSQLAEAFDKSIRRKGYGNRSEAIRDIIRKFLVEEEWAEQRARVVGTVTLVYDHHVHDVSEALTDLQHRHHHMVICSQHVHLNHNNCLETIVVMGDAPEVRSVADCLIGTRGVKHGQLVCTTTGAELV